MIGGGQGTRPCPSLDHSPLPTIHPLPPLNSLEDKNLYTKKQNKLGWWEISSHKNKTKKGLEKEEEKKRKKTPIDRRESIRKTTRERYWKGKNGRLNEAKKKYRTKVKEMIIISKRGKKELNRRKKNYTKIRTVN